MKQETRAKKSPHRRVAEKAEALFGIPYIECRGWRRVTVGGAKKIESMSKERIVVLLDRGSLAILGEELICISFRGGSLTVEGSIESVGKWRWET